MSTIGKVLEAVTIASALATVGGVPSVSMYKEFQFEKSILPLSEVNQDLEPFDTDNDGRLNVDESGNFTQAKIDLNQDGRLSTSEQIKLTRVREQLYSAGRTNYTIMSAWKENIRDTYNNLGTVQEIYRNEEAIQRILREVEQSIKDKNN